MATVIVHGFYNSGTTEKLAKRRLGMSTRSATVAIEKRGQNGEREAHDTATRSATVAMVEAAGSIGATCALKAFRVSTYC